MSDNILVHGVDFSAASSGTGSDLNNLVDAATIAANRGVIITYTDNATPPTTIPDAGTLTDLKRYLLKRTTLAGLVYWYYWDDAAADHATYHKWIALDLTAQTALTNAATAISTANTASDTATQALSVAQDVKTIAQGAATDSENSIFIAGDIKPTLKNFTTPPDGWLECNGASFSSALYPDLYNAIGTTYGGTSTAPLLPNLMGRMLIGAGTGIGLTNRVLGTNYGAESASLSLSNLPEHDHGTGVTNGSYYVKDDDGDIPVSFYGGPSANYKGVLTTKTAKTGVAGSTNIAVLSPCIAVRWLIKT